jgi:hypothetical protein
MNKGSNHFSDKEVECMFVIHMYGISVVCGVMDGSFSSDTMLEKFGKNLSYTRS